MKPGTFTQMYVQLVFAVKNRDAMLTKDIRSGIFKYMSGIITNMKHKSLIINGITNHVHILLGLNPSVSISDTVHEVKRSSSLYINENKMRRSNFSWQEGYGGFTYSRSQISNVYKYIENQEEHHSQKTFRDEYLEYLHKNEIEFDTRFLFDFFDENV